MILRKLIRFMKLLESQWDRAKMMMIMTTRAMTITHSYDEIAQKMG